MEDFDDAGDVTEEIIVEPGAAEIAVFLCPVCCGTRRVPLGFYVEGPYSYQLPAQDCRTCKGKGILWRIKAAAES